MCMTKKQPLLTKPSEPDKVDAYMQNLKHPLADVVAALRQIILGTDGEIGEEIKWNAPTFFLPGGDGALRSKEVQALHRRVQSLSERLHPPGISEGCEKQRQFRILARR